ncbi:MAG TPA: PQQ-binding-like beta-propeller repeat protein [Polyangiaceae bacterium]|jgi:outer membrane protein assembly factor BamB
MRAFEIFVGQASAARDVLDVFVNGANVTAQVGGGGAVLGELARAVATLALAPRGKALVRFYDEPWELCIERLGGVASLSVYRTGAQPEVVVYDARVPFADVVASARDAVLSAAKAGGEHVFELREAATRLEACEVSPDEPPSEGAEPVPVSVELESDVPLAFGAEFSLRTNDDVPAEAAIERTDLHGLIFRGRIRAVVRGRAVELGEAFPFLFAERLLSVMQRVLDAFEQGRPLHVRETAGGVRFGARIGPSGDVALVLANYTFPSLAVSDAVFAALAFGRSLSRALVRRDRSQTHNLRLVAFRRALRETQEHLHDACRCDSKTNPRPEPYRAYATAAPAPVAPKHALAARLRYVPRWRALVPGIDLRATFLCGDRLVVGGAHETFCLDRTSGEVMWRVPTRRAPCVPTPYGIARLHADGELHVLDLVTGGLRARAKLRPRTSGPAAGAVVGAPGLPKLLVVTEGEHHLVAIDLLTGEARWRTAWGNGSVLRLRRLGKLLYYTSGDTAVTAVDVATGSVVWRVRDRLRFCGTPQAAHDVIFAIAGGVSGAGTLYAIDAFEGKPKFAAPLPGPDQSGDLHVRAGNIATVEGSPLVGAHTVAVAVRDREGVRLAAFDRATGALAWTSPATVAPSGTSWLAVDDTFLGNTPTGELVAIDGATGALRYRHVLGRMLEADVPRRLEPVLRGGAVYVPHADVHVFRPSDGSPLGTVGPCDTIPDLLRVDERCDVYVAEESGHMACFGVATRLQRVK